MLLMPASLSHRFNVLNARLNDRFDMIQSHMSDELRQIDAEVKAVYHSGQRRIHKVEEGIVAMPYRFEKVLNPFLEQMANSRKYLDERLS